METKLLQLIGLAMRAGKIVSGEEQVVLAIRQQQVSLVFITEDASENTRKKITDKSTFYKVPYLFIGSRFDLGRAIGKEARVVVGVADKGFAKKMKELHVNDE